MFKNLMLYRLAPDWSATEAQIEEGLAKTPFAECGATQQRSLGWVSPRGEEHGVLIEAIAGQWLLQLMVEHRIKGIPILDGEQQLSGIISRQGFMRALARSASGQYLSFAK